jgi:thiol-disulfide isomerase/thioredoxin
VVANRSAALALASCLLTGVVSCTPPWVKNELPPPAERVAPGFTLTGLDGGTHDLAEYRGRVVLLNFWATWCIPCRAEIPDLEHEARVQDPARVVIIGVDWKEDPAPVSAFIKDIGAGYPILLDRDGRVYDAYEVAALPQTFVLDKAGRIAVSRTGIAGRDQLEAELRSAGA